MYRNKDIIIMDEATSRLDTKTSEFIERQMLESDKTLIMVTHHLNLELENLYDEIINLNSVNKSLESSI